MLKGRKAASRRRNWPGVRDPAGVREQDTLTRVPQEPGRPRRLHGTSRLELPGDQLQARGPANETRVQPWYRSAKATKRGGMGDGESERRIVPGKRGNRPEGPRGGKEAPGHETAGGTDARDTEP